MLKHKIASFQDDQVRSPTRQDFVCTKFQIIAVIKLEVYFHSSEASTVRTTSMKTYLSQNLGISQNALVINLSRTVRDGRRYQRDLLLNCLTLQTEQLNFK